MLSFSSIKTVSFRPLLGIRSLQTQANSASSPSHGSINHSEIAHFSSLSSQWWDEQGEFGLLHKMNPIRMQFIREKLLECAREGGEDEVERRGVLKGKEVLDVGCGGGLLSEVVILFCFPTRIYLAQCPV
jgi:polyprenyldihydroxybenzoate methyltransferase / 3-demethylubiquinol 3-O-methyltransferase